MEKSDLLNHMGQRLYVCYSIFSCVGTLVQINGDVAVFDSTNQIWIPCIKSVTTSIPKPRGPTTTLPANLLELFS